MAKGLDHPRRLRFGRLAAAFAALLAALTVIIATPQHVTDWDDGAAPPAGMSTHTGAHALLDHLAPGHACADHCAAHAFGQLSEPAPAHQRLPVRIAWLTGTATQGPSALKAPPERPPRA